MASTANVGPAGRGEAAADKSAAILQAAVKVFSRHGLAGARVDDIARVAGVGKGTIYEYFSSKDQLFAEMILFAADIQVEAVSAALAAGASLQASLEGALLASLQMAETHQALVRVVMDNVTGGPGRELQRAMFQRQQRLITAIKDTFQRFASKGDVAEQVLGAHMFLGVLQTLTVARLLGQSPHAALDPALDRPAQELATAAVASFLQGFA